MKRRIKIDTSLLLLAILFTFVLFQFPQLYISNRFVVNLLNYLGLCVLLTGNWVRMGARGHKKVFSKKSSSLVTTGPYAYTRNPMYLGSFLLGVGFVVMVWPWWSLPIFAVLFYLRFRMEVVKEEVFLTKTFGDVYLQYKERVPAIFPRLENIGSIDFRKIFPFEEVWMTHEKRGLIGWPLLAFFLELLQEKFIFGQADIAELLAVFLVAAVNFVVLIGITYKFPYAKVAE